MKNELTSSASPMLVFYSIFNEAVFLQNFSLIGTILRQLLEVIIVGSVLQGENLYNPSSVLYLKMNGCYGRVEAGELNPIHFL